MKKIVISFIICCLLMTSPVLADSIIETINVVMNSVNVQINGEDLESQSILYNGTTYLPLRKVAESVGKEVTWNQSTMTANIVDKELLGVIESGFNDTNYIVRFTDGFKVSISLKKEEIKTFNATEGIVLGTNIDELKDKSTVTKPTIIGFENGKRVNPVKYESYSLVIPKEYHNSFIKLDFFENFNNNSDFSGIVYFDADIDNIYYDDGVHQCKLYFEGQ